MSTTATTATTATATSPLHATTNTNTNTNTPTTATATTATATATATMSSSASSSTSATTATSASSSLPLSLSNDSARRDYANFNLKMPSDYWDYEALLIDWQSPEDYEIVAKVGRGKYSEVFEAVDRRDASRCIIKVLKPVRSSKILREVKILQNLRNGVNVISLKNCVRDPYSGTLSMIFEYIGDTDFKALNPSLSPDEIRYYMFELLRALDFCHSRGIMHRDVKPQNIVVNHERRVLRLIDWGLAEFYKPGTSYNVRVASRFFKGPELLVDFREYDYSVDMWSFGCVLAALIFRIEPFFSGANNYEQLLKITKVLGSSALRHYLQKYNRKLNERFDEDIRRCPGIPWVKFVTSSNGHMATREAIDLIDRVLRFDHEERLSPRQAMAHPYFAPLHAQQKSGLHH